MKKPEIIALIFTAMKSESILHKKPFDEGDVFFSLCFKNDNELHHIAKLCGIQTEAKT